MSEQEEPDWSVRQRQDNEEKKARENLIASEFRKRRSSLKRVVRSVPPRYCCC